MAVGLPPLIGGKRGVRMTDSQRTYQRVVQRPFGQLSGYYVPGSPSLPLEDPIGQVSFPGPELPRMDL